MPTNILFLRHAQGTHNKMADVQGAGAYNDPINLDADLTPLGEKQLFENRLFEEFGAIYCSPLRRCRKTLLGVYPRSSELPVILDDRLLEQPCGGNICDKRLPKEEILQTFPESWCHERVSDTLIWQRDDKNDMEKIKSFTDDLLKNHKDTTVLVVCHGTWIQRWTQLYKSEHVFIENCKTLRFTIQ